MNIKRRRLLQALPLYSSAAFASQDQKPGIRYGFSIGEVNSNSALLWLNTGRPASVLVECSQNTSFDSPLRFTSRKATKAADYNLKVALLGLQAGRKYYVRCHILSSDGGSFSTEDHSGHFLFGRFKTASLDANEPLRFCWSGDTCGQGYGIDTAHDGFLSYRAMLDRQPDFFVHCGDQIYADGPLEPEKKAENGLVWKNWLTTGKAKVAESLQEFRDAFYYNCLDKHYQEFHRNVPVYHMWDDHEVVNNWYPGERLDGDNRYREKDVNTLVKRAKQAFSECLPVVDKTFSDVPLYRHVSRGPLLDLFFVDLRSYRGPNSENEQKIVSSETDFFGRAQLDWFKQSLLDAKGIWKIVCIDMPISILVKEWGTNISENAANSNGVPAGREFEYTELLSFINENDIKNVHFVTADVHYCASYHCHPDRAVFKNFKPFWEFISGPLHAGTFGPNDMDNSFGPKAEFIGLPEEFEAGCSPAQNLQFFGEMEIDPHSKSLTVRHFNRLGQMLWDKTIYPESRHRAPL